jgi:hypothetical protein
LKEFNQAFVWRSLLRSDESSIRDLEVIMTFASVRRLVAVSLCVLFASFISDPRADDSAAPGDLWEIVSKMSMEGMNFSMPAQHMKVCAAKNWTQPPGGDNAERGCTSSGMLHDPNDSNVITWNSVCADGMTGTGRIVRTGDDAYEGEIRYTSDNGNVLIKLQGQRVGDCDNPR